MANPANTTRINPSSITNQRILEDGHPSLIAFSRNPSFAIWEITVTPPGIDGGDLVNITTMHNATWRTMVPRRLKTLTTATVVAGYDPVVYDQLLDQINYNQSMTNQFSDGSDLDFFGVMRTFETDAITEGEMPQATCQIDPTNWDPANDVEAGPVMTEVLGT